MTAESFPSSSTTSVPLWVPKVLSAAFYACCSLFLMTVNKSILTSYGFPSYEVLGFGQIVTTVVVLGVAKLRRKDLFPDWGLQVIRKVSPLSVIFACNLLFGLGGTKKLSLPMFTVLRRFSILFTMVGEYFLLRVRPSYAVQIGVYGMIAGTIIAALNDLSFDATGYVFLLLNDVFTAANAVVIKSVLDAKEGKLGEYGLLFYNAALMLVPSFMYVLFTGELDKAIRYEQWNNFAFLLGFCCSCVMGFVISYSIVLCTMYNSALTTTVIGALKNILTIYIGMSIGGDYIFSWANFIGLNISVLASMFYSYVVFFEADRKRAKLPAAPASLA